MQRREVILEVASKLLRLYGYSGFSYGDIAKKVGISTASLHYHFPTKEDLAIALCLRIQEYWQQCFAAIEADCFNKTPLVALNQYINAILKTLGECDICPLIALLSDYPATPEKLKSAIQQVTQQEFELIKRFVDQAINVKALDEATIPERYTAQIIAYTKGALLYRRISGPNTMHFQALCTMPLQ